MLTVYTKWKIKLLEKARPVYFYCIYWLALSKPTVNWCRVLLVICPSIRTIGFMWQKIQIFSTFRFDPVVFHHLIVAWMDLHSFSFFAVTSYRSFRNILLTKSYKILSKALSKACSKSKQSKMKKKKKKKWCCKVAIKNKVAVKLP